MLRYNRSKVVKTVIVTGGLALFLAACGSQDQGAAPQPSQTASPPAIHHYGDVSNAQDRRQQLHEFITEHMTGPYGIYTNLQDTAQDAELTTGHELLSESAGLMMRQAVLNGNRTEFEQVWELARQTFDSEEIFSYRYSPKLAKRYSVNAAVDDMRIIRALYEAANEFQAEEYRMEADRYGARFYGTNVKNGQLHDFFDEEYSITNDFITLCYIDLKTLELLSVDTEQKQKLLDRMELVIKEGYLSNEFPFYQTRYSYGTGEYSGESVNTVESLLTILHLAEVGKHKPESISFIKEKVSAGEMYGRYSTSGKAETDIRSTAIYAITAMIGSVLGDQSLYEESISQMNQFQISDKTSGMMGGFGDTGTKQAYSFDNLMALLAYSY
ncbi:hypothetical protein ACX93W_04720 [Paenibacillus sp. CAU 1782]